jgi:hypothetical protein
MIKKDKTIKCLRPECGGEAFKRGLCGPCYRRACKLVRRGKTTWENLENNKKCLKTMVEQEYKIRDEWFLSDEKS